MATGLTAPIMSPLWGRALPDLEIRALTCTWSKADNRAAGIMAMESSSVTVNGRSRAVLRTTARGMGGPFTARAKMNRVSSGDTSGCSAPSSDTDTVSDTAAAAMTLLILALLATGRLQIWMYDTTTGEERQITNHGEYDVKYPSLGTGAIVYDNQIGDEDDAPLTTIIGGGSIVIHE